MSNEVSATDKKAGYKDKAGKKAHPAKFSPSILTELEKLIPSDFFVLDPFAGVGGIHQLSAKTIGVELEPEWAMQSKHTLVGNALDLPFDDGTFDAVVTSPCYGNRMADNYEAKDGSKRFSYRHALGHELSPMSSAVMQWGEEYQLFHIKAWDEVYRVLKPFGIFCLNVSNHIRGGQEMTVAEWHLGTLLRQRRWFLRHIKTIETKRMRRGANSDKRVDHEFIFVLEKI